jgi:uncharacterized protein YuzE
MKTEQHHFTISGGPPPVVEVDSRAGAVYVRFKTSQVAKTVPQECEAMNIAVDLDAKGEVVGIEAVGITQFTLKLLLQKASVKAPQLDYSRARYVPSELVAAN